MERPLDVLIMETTRGGARSAVVELEAAGHRTHRCRDDGAPAFPCRGVVDPSTCPLEGPVDVTLVVRNTVHPSTSTLEDGVSCSLRAGVPVVEDGTSILDPFEGWLTTRVGDRSVASACEEAASTGFAGLVTDVVASCARLVRTWGGDPGEMGCRTHTAWPSLQVEVEVPVHLNQGQQEALAVRALDAVRAGRRSFGKVNVQVHGASAGANDEPVST